MQKSDLHIRDVDIETKRKITAYAKANSMHVAGALRVLVDKALSAGETPAAPPHSAKTNSNGPPPERWGSPRGSE
jgi:hypothetical protein